MKSQKLLTVAVMVVWWAVALTAAPKAFLHHGSAEAARSQETPAQSCADLNINFADHPAEVQSEERTISLAEAPSLSIQAQANGGLQVDGWDQQNYSVTLCKAAEAGSNAEMVLSQVHITYQAGQLGISGPPQNERWTAHLLVRAPKNAGLDLNVKNGPMDPSNLNGKLTVHGQNGPISVVNCAGELVLTAKNGPVTLEGNGGKQTVEAENGPLDLSLEGNAWNGEGLQASSKNGPVLLRIPSGYQSGVVVESEGHSPFQCNSRVCSEGRKTWDDEHKRIEFGSGPMVVHVTTVNGPVSVH